MTKQVRTLTGLATEILLQEYGRIRIAQRAKKGLRSFLLLLLLDPPLLLVKLDLRLRGGLGGLSLSRPVLRLPETEELYPSRPACICQRPLHHIQATL